MDLISNIFIALLTATIPRRLRRQPLVASRASRFQERELVLQDLRAGSRYRNRGPEVVQLTSYTTKPRVWYSVRRNSSWAASVHVSDFVFCHLSAFFKHYIPLSLGASAGQSCVSGGVSVIVSFRTSTVYPIMRGYSRYLRISSYNQALGMTSYQSNELVPA
jgi:hypothetical protein